MRVLLSFVALQTVLGMTAPVHGSFLDAFFSYLDRCRSMSFEECLNRDLAQSIDLAMKNNGTYRLNRYLTVTVQAAPAAARDGREATDDDDPAERFLDLFNALHIRYEPEEPENFSEGTYGCTTTSIWRFDFLKV